METYRKNLKIFFIALLFIVVGNILMITKTNSTPTFFDPQVFNLRAITIAPLVIFSGYVLIIVGILIKPKAKNAV